VSVALTDAAVKEAAWFIYTGLVASNSRRLLATCATALAEHMLTMDIDEAGKNILIRSLQELDQVLAEERE